MQLNGETQSTIKVSIYHEVDTDQLGFHVRLLGEGKRQCTLGNTYVLNFTFAMIGKEIKEIFQSCTEFFDSLISSDHLN